jgi:hypothetical protein
MTRARAADFAPRLAPQWSAVTVEVRRVYACRRSLTAGSWQFGLVEQRASRNRAGDTVVRAGGNP